MTALTLKERRAQLIEELQNLEPAMLRGSLVKIYKRCGKPNCHCVEERGHESHYLSVSMAARNPIMIYVSLKNQDVVKKALATYQAVQRIIEEISTINRELLTQKEIL